MNTNVEKGAVGVAFFGGAGEMREACRAFDWAATPLGPVESWPASIRTATALVLASPFPMELPYGAALTQAKCS